MLVVGLAANSVRCTALADPMARNHSSGRWTRPSAVTDQLDRILDRSRGRSCISAAWIQDFWRRGSHAGRHDIQLSSFAFDAADSEHRMATQMASRLGLRCERVSYERAKPSACWSARDRTTHSRLAISRPFPPIFSCASLPQAAAAAAVVGTGADGAFGLGALFRKWHLVYPAPQADPSPGRGVYDLLALWRTDSRVERLSRFVRKVPTCRSLRRSRQNALEGIAYDAP
jgi:hypothetical protein